MEENTAIKLKHYMPSTNWWAASIWGGGHTQATDPTWAGWRTKRAGLSEDVVLVERRAVHRKKGGVLWTFVPLSNQLQRGHS